MAVLLIGRLWKNHLEAVYERVPSGKRQAEIPSHHYVYFKYCLVNKLLAE